MGCLPARHNSRSSRNFSGDLLFCDEVRNEISLGSNLVNVMTTSSRSAIIGLQCKDAKGGKTLTGSQTLIVGSPFECPVTSCKVWADVSVRETMRRFTLYLDGIIFSLAAYPSFFRSAYNSRASTSYHEEAAIRCYMVGWSAERIRLIYHVSFQQHAGALFLETVLRKRASRLRNDYYIVDHL